MKKPILLTVTILTIISLFYSCDKSTEPEIIKPGRRDYTWTVDTLQIFANYLSKMWGSSPTDVWAVGAGATSENALWHYDGNKWEMDGTYTTLPDCIYGFKKIMFGLPDQTEIYGIITERLGNKVFR